jgi:hypothetical protein
VCQISSKYQFIKDGGRFFSSRCPASYHMFSELSEAFVFNIDCLLNYDGVRVVTKAI